MAADLSDKWDPGTRKAVERVKRVVAQRGRSLTRPTGVLSGCQVGCATVKPSWLAAAAIRSS